MSPKGPSLFRTKPCRFFTHSGHCHFGDKCRFSHENPIASLQTTSSAAMHNNAASSYNKQKQFWRPKAATNGPPQKNETGFVQGKTSLETGSFHPKTVPSIATDKFPNLDQKSTLYSGTATTVPSQVIPSQSKTGRYQPRAFAKRAETGSNGVRSSEIGNFQPNPPSEVVSKEFRVEKKPDKPRTKPNGTGIEQPKPIVPPAGLNFALKRSDISDEKLLQLRLTDMNSARKRFPDFVEGIDGVLLVDVGATDPDWVNFEGM